MDPSMKLPSKQSLSTPLAQICLAPPTATHLALTLLLLELEGDTTDGSLLNSLHQVSGESGNLVPQSLGWDDGDLIDDPLVGVEVDGVQSRVVLLDEHPGGSLGCLGADSTLKEAVSEAAENKSVYLFCHFPSRSGNDANVA